MDLRLKGKVALVTGSASQIGYGRSIAVALAREGCALAAADMDVEGAKKTAAEIDSLGYQAMAVEVDVTNRAQIDQMVRLVLERFGRIDILVNNAGTSSKSLNFEIGLGLTPASDKVNIKQLLLRNLN